MTERPGLFSEFEGGGLHLKNRIVMPPMASDMADPEGRLTERHFNHYLPRAESGVGLLIIEHCYVHPTGRAKPTMLGAHRKDLFGDFARLVEEIHRRGAKVAIQLNHGGGAAFPEATGGRVYAPSPVMHPRGKVLPEEMPVSLMDDVLEAFVEAAVNAKEAGFDAVEIHGAHGYLLNQFVSPLLNRREDEYGGSLENRLRYPLRVLRAVREALGRGCPLLFRFGMSDFAPFLGKTGPEAGLTPEEGQKAIPSIEKAGVDILDISGGVGGSRPEGAPRGYFLPLADLAREVTGLPLNVTGGITEPEFADEIIRSGRSDLVGIGRAYLKDASWAKKAREKLG